MICAYCRKEIPDHSDFCLFCGARLYAPPRATKRLMRSAADRKIAGVCGGIAEYFNVDSTLIRLIWVVAVILPIPFLPAFIGYFVAWLVMPKAPLPADAAAQRPPVIIPNQPPSP